MAFWKRPRLRRRKRNRWFAQLKEWLKKRWQYARAKWLFHRGVIALHRGRYQHAANLLEQARQVLDNDPFVHAHLGWAHRFLGHPVSARRHLVRAVELAPDNPSLLTLAGRLLALRGKWEEAEEFLRHAVSLAPHNIVAQSWLAFTLLQRDQPQEALHILKQTPVADDPYLQARLILSLERLVRQRGERQGAPLPFPQWKCPPFLAPLVGWFFRWRGERLLEDGRWDDAIRWLSAATSLHPSDTWAKLLLAVALIEGGYLSLAETVLMEVPEDVPERAWAYGALLVRQQRVGEAILHLAKSETQHPFVRYYLALAVDWTGEGERACAIYLEPLYREDPSSLRQRLRELIQWLQEEGQDDS